MTILYGMLGSAIEAYPHKILTNRKHLIETIRSKEGLSPFPKRKESKYDAFWSGAIPVLP